MVISMATEKAMMILWMKGEVAEVGLDQLEHADVGRHPRQRAEADDEEQPLGVAAVLSVPLAAFIACSAGCPRVRRDRRAQAQSQRIPKLS